MDHTVCALQEISIKTLRAWARAISFAADLASQEELAHALDHFRAIQDATYGHATAGNLIGIDARCAEEIHDELARRDGSAVSQPRGSVTS